MSWLPPILLPSPTAFYNFGPHTDYDLPIIRHFGAQGYKALSQMEAHRMEFSCGNLPFGTMAPRTSLSYPAKPVREFQDRVAQPPSAVNVSNNRGAQPPGSPARAGLSVARDGVEVPSAANASSQEPKANSQEPVFPNKNAPGNNVSTASDVSVHRASDEAKQVSASSDSLASGGPLGRRERSELNISTNQRESAAKNSGVVLPKTVPNPQPIPFPTKAELEAQGYRFGPFHPEYNPTDVEMIAYYAKRGYRPLQPHEVDYAEFRCNGVPFAKAADVPHRPKPQEPPPPQKSPEQAERDALLAKIRRDREAPPACAERENIRLAPTKR